MLHPNTRDSGMVGRCRADSGMIGRCRADSGTTVQFRLQSASLEVVDRARLDERLRIVEIRSPSGSTGISNDLDGWVEFDPNGSLRVSDSVNVRSGAISPVPDGVQLAQVVMTLVGYDRRDPTRVALIDAVAAIVQEGNTIAIRSTADTLTLAASGYRLICSR